MASFLEDIINVSSKIQSVIGHIVGDTSKGNGAVKLASEAPPLVLPDADSQSLRQALSIRPISDQLVTALLEIFESRQSKTRGCYTSHWHAFFTNVASLQDTSLQLLEKAFQGKYLQDLRQLQQRILAVLDGRLDKFNLDAEASAQSELESSSEDGMIVRGHHSRLAVKILEMAYSRTTNISRAEKIRLAAATKLEPRQVTIWFQNRRNRKVAPAAIRPAEEAHSSPATPTTPSDGSRKRKAGGLYEWEIRHPSQRLRTTTPDNESHRHVYLSSTSSTSSMGSSVDSLASFYKGIVGKDRNYSSQSSEMDTFDTVYSAKGLASTSFDDQIDLQAHRLPSIVVKSEEDPYSTLMFSDTGRTQLDFDDLGLDLNSLVDELPSFEMSEFDFQPSAWTSTQLARAQSDINRTPKQPTFAVPLAPTSMIDAADALVEYPVNIDEEVKRARQIEEWAFGLNLLLEKNGEEEDDPLYLNLDGLRSKGKNSPTSDTMSTSGSSSNVATPPDLFDFSFEGLHLDQFMNERLESYQDQESIDSIRDQTPDFEMATHKRPQSLSIDTDLAAAYPQDDDMPTARNIRQEIEAI